MKVLVYSSRHWKDDEEVEKVLSQYSGCVFMVKNACGAERIASKSFLTEKWDWNTLKRNKPDLILMFHASPETCPEAELLLDWAFSNKVKAEIFPFHQNYVPKILV